ncbi:hypothetical protein [Streptomyces sp. Go-475]|uniref:hypothetical protein n=1 Tax=Streptomyces sp. Go-475 TaxID=2072505 RepID=UPI0013008F47|nr:hypothetical protein [Streptomyces sp. Go-475]
MTAIIVDPSRSIPRHRFRSSPEAETRLLLLIDGFSRKRGGEVRSLEGRVKLAKLDFLLRYPKHLVRVLESIGVGAPDSDLLNLQEAPLDSRMMRYRYGPWDPSYYAVLGSLIGRGLVKVEPLPRTSGLGYSTTSIGASLASELSKDESFSVINARIKVLRRHLDKSGSTLKDYLYKLPEVADSTWHEEIG